MPTGVLAPFFHAAGVSLSEALLAGPAPAPAAATALSASTAPAPAVSASPVPASADSASALPSWLLVALLVFVGLIVVAMFALTFYNLSAPRSTLKNVLGQKRRGLLGTLGFTAPKNAQSTPPVSQHVIDSLGLSARVGKRTTRTTLAITGFSLLGVIVVAVFGVSGEGVRDLRNQVVTAVTTLVATIAGFYFGSDAGKNSSNNNPPPPNAAAGTPPDLQPDPDAQHSQFTIGTQGAYTPQISGTSPVTISSTDALPAGLQLDASTGAITGTPAAGTAATYNVTLTAHNAFPPDATLNVTLTVIV